MILRILKSYSIVLLLILHGFIQIHAQLTININSIPPNTPPNSDIYIAGNFNNWNPGNTTYQLIEQAIDTYSITFTPNPGLLEFKFTRGSWETVEGNSSGGFIPNRTYNYPGGVQSLNLSIAGWEDNTGGGHTATSNVEIIDEQFYIPQLDRTRRIWIYLPPDYHTSSKNYPVIYMQDGQNLFDAYYSFAGEWELDESMNALFDQGDHGAIIVGIDNGGGERLNEYSAWVNPSYGGGQGEAYAEFLVQTLKPFIDSHYNTLPGRDYTAIGGSSMGANISLFTAIEYQDVFSKVGIFSPAFWFSDSSYIHIQEKGIQQNLRFYFLAGQNESPSMVPNMIATYEALKAAGQDENEMFLISHADGAHSEWYWAREYPAVYDWLFSTLILSDIQASAPPFTLFPNPAKDFITIFPEPNQYRYTIYSIPGLDLISQSSFTGPIDTSGFMKGLYVLEIKNKSNQTVFVTRFLKQ